MNEWLYQFWLFSFKSAKYWGYGPRDWTSAELHFDAFEAIPTSHHGTPGSSTSVFAASPHVITSPSENDRLSQLQPSQLCKWAIHVTGAAHDLPRTGDGAVPGQNPNDANIGKPWDPTWKTPAFDDRMRDALEHNDFSTLKSDQLPVAIPQVAKEAERPPDEMLLESLSFAIIARNVDLTEELVDKCFDLDVDVRPCYPFHLAAIYLDGSKACCTIFNALIEKFRGGIPPRSLVDDLEHTVIDKLLLVILKSHITTLPSIIDPTNHERRFPGDELDICGRWDADSDCYRLLLSRGVPAAPPEWKHKFCHTSAKAICDIIILARNTFISSFTERSGLFTRLCTSCGSKLTMSHLHALVITAFHLAQSGMDDEDLFGILACVCQMLTLGADPGTSCDISLELLDIEVSDNLDMCTHEEFTPTELAQRIGSHKTAYWPENLVTGWEILYWVLSRSQNSWASSDRAEDDDDDQDCCYQRIYHKSDHFGKDPILGTLWASVKTELLTYRRVNVGDSWVSANFDMERLLWGVEDETESGSGSCGERPYERSLRLWTVL